MFLLKFTVLTCLIGLSVSLYPFESISRSKVSLNGLWEFKVDFNNEGFTNQWYNKAFLTDFSDSLPIAVPSSYNDLYTNGTIRDHIGWTWYNRQFYVNDAVINNLNRYLVTLRFASCHYFCVAWINGVKLGQHESGHLPFEFDITSLLTKDKTLNLVVATNNTLTPNTIPPAGLFYGTNSLLYPNGFVEQKYQMDFFNFAGIHRDVAVYIKPLHSIQDIDINTDYDPSTSTGTIKYQVSHNCVNTPVIQVFIKDNTSNIVAVGYDDSDTLTLKNAIPWWPKFMNGEQPVAYLYMFEVHLSCNGSTQNDVFSDVYSLDFGIRTISWSGNFDPTWKINSKNFYCMGANKHEDFPVLGRGIDLAILLKDVSLYQWLNANCMRTSHYPYAEEFMQLADRLGIAVIDEVPAVGLAQKENFNTITLALHRNLLHELYNRDKNHACVVAWSVANEPSTELPESVPYFKEIFSTIRAIDQSRPKTFTTFKTLDADLCANMSDIIFLNRYYGWYINTGRLDIIEKQLTFDLKNWYGKYGKPVLLSEYGADTLPGTHCFPEEMFCEEYQSTLLMEHHKVFDNLRAQSILFGELIWNLVDFMTAADVRRAYGNHKGMFTFLRQPKQAAFVLKNRYNTLKNTL